MGLLDGLKSALGMKAEADATRDADPEDLFGMSTAYMTMEADLGFAPAEAAALCFADVDSTDFEDAVENVEAILEAGEVETGTKARFTTDDHGYEWVVLEDDDPEDLVTSIHFAADEFIERGYGSRLLAALFAFEKSDAGRHRNRGGEAAGGGQRAYWIYSFRRGKYYPFAPEGDHERHSQTEIKLQSVLDGELTVEPDKEYWYPLWPDRPGGHPWE
ncbi:PspA-associated protein PspAB [Halosimplex amylolyticum]|uniref:PspA-associated protein PspAB n=1 Tax=Halosimplex amylolyticum TaxID=3396616 RepID=UPI003F5714B2